MNRFVTFVVAAVLALASVGCNDSYEEWAAEYSGNYIAVCADSSYLEVHPNIVHLWPSGSPLIQEGNSSPMEMYRTVDSYFCALFEGKSDVYRYTLKSTPEGRKIKELIVKFRDPSDIMGAPRALVVPRNSQMTFVFDVEFPKLAEGEIPKVKAAAVPGADQLAGTEKFAERPEPRE